MEFLPWSSGRFLLHEEAPLDILSKSTANLYAKPSIGSGILVYAVIPSDLLDMSRDLSEQILCFFDRVLCCVRCNYKVNSPIEHYRQKINQNRNDVPAQIYKSHQSDLLWWVDLSWMPSAHQAAPSLPSSARWGWGEGTWRVWN